MPRRPTIEQYGAALARVAVELSLICVTQLQNRIRNTASQEAIQREHAKALDTYHVAETTFNILHHEDNSNTP